MSEDSERSFDEKDYRIILGAGTKEALFAAKRAFGAFGFRANFNMIADRAISLEYPQGDDFLPLRTLHHARHIGAFLDGARTQLPALHSVMTSSAYGVSGHIDRAGSSLTSSQLVFEMLRAVGGGDRFRAAGLAMELASRGKTELLMETLRDEGSRRYAYAPSPLLVLNAVMCALLGREITESAARISACAVTDHGISADALNARRALRHADVSIDRAAENDHFTDNVADTRVTVAIRSGIPEMALQVIADELRKGVSARHILNTVCIEALLGSAVSAKKSTYEFAVQNSSSLLEWMASCGLTKAADIIEMMAIASHLSQIYSPGGADSDARSVSSTCSFKEAVSLFENGNPRELISSVSPESSGADIERISKYVAGLSVNCDQAGLYSEAMCHCSSSILSGVSLESRTGQAYALRECLSYLSALKIRGAECRDTVDSIIRTGSKTPE